MKVVQRGIMNILPGKMEEAMKLLGEHIALACRLANIPREKLVMRTYRPYFGGGDSLHEMIVEIEWDSLSVMTDFFNKAMRDQEMQALMPKWDAVEKSHHVQILMLIP